MEIGATASAIFGSKSASSVFSAGETQIRTPAQQSAEVIITAQKREINVLRGYKPTLSQTEKQRLSELEEIVRDVEKKSLNGTARQDEIDDRIEAIAEADEIIGKPVVDVEADETLAEYNALKVGLLEPVLDSIKQKRVDKLTRLKAGLEEQIAENPGRRLLTSQFQTVSRQLEQVNPLNSPSDLSPAAQRTYDDVVELINNHTGVKLELTVGETRRVEELQSSISKLQSQLGPELGSGPTAAAVSRAYSTLSFR